MPSLSSASMYAAPNTDGAAGGEGTASPVDRHDLGQPDPVVEIPGGSASPVDDHESGQPEPVVEIPGGTASPGADHHADYPDPVVDIFDSDSDGILAQGSDNPLNGDGGSDGSSDGSSGGIFGLEWGDGYGKDGDIVDGKTADGD
ncbi:unnamed protein product [Pylaiella littoralis]